MINIIICDDERAFSSLINNKLNSIINKSSYCDLVYNIYTMNDSEEVLHYSEQNTIHIAFLDIDMPKVNGFDIAARLKETHKDIKLVFVSNFDQFVYTSLRFNPFRFIRKNYIENELDEAFNSAMKDILLVDKFISLGTKYNYERILYSNILYIESRSNYVQIVTVKGDKYLHRITMTLMEEALSQFGFVRIHSGFLVSMNKIKYYKNDKIELINGDYLRVSRKYISSFKDSYYSYLRERG